MINQSKKNILINLTAISIILLMIISILMFKNYLKKISEIEKTENASAPYLLPEIDIQKYDQIKKILHE
ncbi:MAG: hypothetical protein UR27_C0003G0071 [Candidatus Peregrinibacteria bacterium GW2011_GWA2_33_10]|nr:MAG: hypothetical protein UR27_C0003G0071 [Candidatus Peregrinibacteria bacterium GW2011_GWA2_33_10]KKP40797.1 MAG: hypothetical protein UR30_C0004G0055 [Candidatus Peregrinibacteria bacterium GW2011_GWC2_33_13]OGJ48042.1 MAG: hypothetical protein A2229_03340 [Candidatus Peregrinibacteria bacterium RIFOXYA2_FULL_33_7]